MKLVISPAKSLNFESEIPFEISSEPQFLKQSERLNKLLRKKSARSLSKLMSISEALGQLNYERNQSWELPFTKHNARPAIYAFNGDVYRGLDAYTIPEDKLETALWQKNFEPWAMTDTDKIKILINFRRGTTHESIHSILGKCCSPYNQHNDVGVWKAEIDADAIITLAADPHVIFIEQGPHPMQPLHMQD